MSPTPTSDRPLARLLAYARPQRARVRMAAAYSFLNKLFDLAPPLLIGAAVDVVVTREESLLARVGVVDPVHQLWALALLTIVIWGLESVFEYLFQVAWRNLAQTIQHQLRIELYDHVQSLDVAWFEERGTGELMSVLNDDVNQLERFLDTGANELIQVGTTVLVIGAVFFALAPTVAVLAFLPVPFVLFGSFRYQALLIPRYARVREKVGSLNSRLAINLGGIRTIKSFTNEAHELSRLEKESRGYEAVNQDAIRLSAAFVPIIRMVIVVGFVATLIAGGHLALAGTLAIGSFSVLVFLTQRLLWPLTRLGETFDLYQRAMASTTRALDLLDTQRALVDGERALALGDVRGALSLRDVHFAYRPDVPVLQGLDLEVPAGQTVAVVGATGSGKSTLVKLLLRFYDPTRGSITLDDHALPGLTLRSLRDAVGLVSQDVFLFHGTVRENIAYGKLDATDEQILEAARKAEALEFIEALPEGLDTVVGERGQKLSGGQQQRLSIARAILKDPPILVFDEATSAVDNETEAAIQRSLAEVSRGRTTVVIAHRLSTIRAADRIDVLSEGRVVESGRHEELLALDGVYAALWRVQTGELPSH
ncbi:MAG: ABC transporter ATP-binding protein [Polyangiales bacterium]|nr:ABC transporter ATP-binding protein [Myxococcales bacterium]MCB9658496.1 ABC transporter ATP-binding protein [Sandaracinaceae bacterium]